MKLWKYYNHVMIPTIAPHEKVDDHMDNFVRCGSVHKSKISKHYHLLAE